MQFLNNISNNTNTVHYKYYIYYKSLAKVA